MIRPGRRAFSLVEVVLFSGIAVVMLGALWSFFAESVKRGSRSAGRLAGAEAVFHLSAVLESDLAALLEHDASPIGYRVEEGARILAFVRHAETSPDASWDPPPPVRVEYRFEPATGRVLRRTEPGGERVVPGKFAALDAWIEAVTLPELSARSWRLAYRLAAHGDAGLAENPGSGAVVIGAVPLRSRSMRSLYPFWHRDPWADPGG